MKSFTRFKTYGVAACGAALILGSLMVSSLLSVAGCGGSSSSSTASSSPTASTSPTASASPGTGTGGAVADGCTNNGTLIAQSGWVSTCGVPVQPTRKWTVLLYMNGANDLETYGLLNLNQIEQYGSDSNVTFVAQFKRIKTGNSDDDTSDGDWTGARRYVVRKDSDSSHVSSPIISTRASIDMGDPQTLKDFISWGIQTFPAEHYAIVLWNHGAGWRSRAAATGRGFSYDDETGNHIDTIQLPDALDLGNSKKWDLVAWDSSLMQMIEVAYEIRNKANYIVGGEESPPGTGYPYQTWVASLTGTPDMDAPTLGGAICDSMLSGYGASSNITQSVLDTSKINAVASAMNSFGAALLAAKATYGTQIAEDRDNSEYYDYTSNKDFYDFARLVKTNVSDSTVQTTASNVQAAIQAAVLKNVHGNLHPNSNGIAIYIPTPNTYSRDDITQANGFGQRYSALTISKDYPNWQTFLTQGPQ